MDLIVNTGSCD